MISSNQYQDIEIQQSSDFTNVITFDSTHTMDAERHFVGKIQIDFANSTFTGPQKTGANSGVVGTEGSNDVWESATVTQTYFDVVASISGNTVTLTLPAEATQYFTDDFEGVWELLEKDTTGSGVTYTRQIQGDVLISKSAIQLDNTFKVAA
jgi:hypothetical protein